MVRLVRRLAWALLAVAFVLPPLAHADKLYVVPGIVVPADKKSKELEALTAPQADQIARRDLLSVLQPTGKYARDAWQPADGNVYGMTFYTWPYPTEYQGVCRKDAVTLNYRLVSHHDARKDLWSHDREPQGVQTQQAFYVAALPIESAGPIPICDAQHPGERANWFFAPDVEAAVRAMNMFRAAEAQLKAGTLNPEPCNRSGPDACRQWIASLDALSKLDRIEVCEAKEAGELCYVLSIADVDLTIQAMPSATDPANPTAITTIRVDAVTYVTE